jgi:hypothetical protein
MSRHFAEDDQHDGKDADADRGDGFTTDRECDQRDDGGSRGVHEIVADQDHPDQPIGALEQFFGDPGRPAAFAQGATVAVTLINAVSCLRKSGEEMAETSRKASVLTGVAHRGSAPVFAEDVLEDQLFAEIGETEQRVARRVQRSAWRPRQPNLNGRAAARQRRPTR